ncbi:MAG TPA: cellulase family glycosylhydrolase [Terriglobales bacterium]|nr:cellulase family glycosylhydrolase [Terriglobales bacterium]
MSHRLVAVFAAALLGSLLGCDDPADRARRAELLPLHATRGENAAIFDSAGRQVLLRGVNLNVLGDYYQASPALEPVYPFAAEMFAEIAAHGFDVVRLIVSWSALEPQPGQIDRDYLARIRQAVDAAAANGVYVVLDMHQDAWGKHIATRTGEVCPPNKEPAIGWDGAPAWATLTDGASTCRSPGFREDSPAVVNAFLAFYEDRDGIQSRLVEAWAALAAELAGDAAVAGYDLLNEPHYVSVTRAETASDLGRFYGRTIAAIRAAEIAAGGFPHIIFFEPLIHFPLVGSTPPPDFTEDENIVFAPHNYAESINSFFTIEMQFQTIRRAASRYDTTFWIGEWGWFGAPAENQARVVRYGQQEDLHLVGGTWWQWLQACGDPHNLGGAVAAGDLSPGVEAAPAEQIQFHRITCPGGEYQVIEEWAQVLGRARPLAAPGRILTLASDGLAGTLHLTGDAEGADPVAPLELWVPARAPTTPVITGVNLAPPEVREVAGGYRISAQVSGSYQIDITY